jgi:membrane protease YdiL (CAAX protease family)
MTTSILMSNKSTSNSLVNKYPLAVFFLLVLGWTWPFMIWDALASHDILPFRLPIPVMLIQSYMPTLAAVIVIGLIKGTAGIRALFRKLRIARVGFRWHIFAIFGMAATSIAALLLGNLFGFLPALPILSKEMPTGLIAVLLNATILFVVTGILNGEELAWRGFALPRLQSKYNALTSSLILSVPWTLFHLPLFFDLNMNMGSFASFAIRIAATTILFTWMFNNTRGSVLLAYMLHAAGNTWTRIFSIDPGYYFQDWMITAVTVILAIVVTAISGAENLSRTNIRIQE